MEPQVTLRPLTFLDCDYYRWFNDPAVTAHNSHGAIPMKWQDAADYLSETDDVVFGITIPAVRRERRQVFPEVYKRHIGNIALQNVNQFYGSADLSLIIGEKDYWGKGVGKAACRLMIEHAFTAMNLRRIAIGTFATNEAMKALAVSLGFQWEGLRRKAAWKNGQYIDIVEYGLLREEWTGANSSDN